MGIWRGQWPVVATLAAIALVGLLLQPLTVVKVATADGAVLACRRIAPASVVTLVFTHSMYGGEVRESWRADGSRLARVRIETDNAAAAEYYATNGRVERTDHGFTLIAPPLEVGALAIRVDQIGKHRLRFGAEELSLSDQVDGSAAAEMSVTQMALISYVFGKN